MISAVIPVIVMIVGALLYALSVNPKVAEMGRIAFSVGLLWSTYAVLGHAIHIG